MPLDSGHLPFGWVIANAAAADAKIKVTSPSTNQQRDIPVQLEK